MPTIAAAYIRVSTEDQIEFSPDSQLKRILEYAEQHQIQIPPEFVFIDEGISGRTASKRPAFQQMISLARTQRNFQKILVWKFSRFARNRQDSIFYKSMLRKDCGIEVISITEPLSQDPTSILIEALLEAMDEYYSVNLAEEVKRGMQERFSRGKCISIPPFGYQMGNHSFEPNPVQAPWISIIFESYIHGEGFSAIATRLNTANVRTTRGNPFQARNITYILHNPVYIGKLRKRSSTGPTSPSYDRNYRNTPMELIDGIHTPLISKELWKLTQQKLASDSLSQNPTTSLPTSLSPETYFLQGLVYCGTCGRLLIPIHKGTAFQCSGYNHGICHISHYIQASSLATLVLDALTPILPPAILVYLIQPQFTPAEKNEVLRNLSIHMVFEKEERLIRIH